MSKDTVAGTYREVHKTVCPATDGANYCVCSRGHDGHPDKLTGKALEVWKDVEDGKPWIRAYVK